MICVQLSHIPETFHIKHLGKRQKAELCGKQQQKKDRKRWQRYSKTSLTKDLHVRLCVLIILRLWEAKCHKKTDKMKSHFTVILFIL